MTDPSAATPPPLAPRPMWQIVLAVLFGALVVIVVAVLLGGKGGAGRQEAGAPVAALAQLPWRAQVEPSGGVQVMGLTVGGRAASRLEQAQALWPGEAMKVAVVQAGGGAASLEAFLELVQVGTLQGKLILSGGVEAAQLADWVARAPSNEPQPSGARRYALGAADLQTAAQAPVTGLVFLPGARLEEATVRERFGAQAERVGLADGSVHLLYPERGLVVSLDGNGKARPVLQFVAPAEFEERLLRPLRAAAAASAP